MTEYEEVMERLVQRVGRRNRDNPRSCVEAIMADPQMAVLAENQESPLSQRPDDGTLGTRWFNMEVRQTHEAYLEANYRRIVEKPKEAGNE